MKLCVGADIPTLPIHDSLRVEARHEGNVVEFMAKSYRDRVRGKNFCIVRTKPDSVRQMGEGSVPLPSRSLPPPSSAPGKRPEKQAEKKSRAPVRPLQLDFLAQFDAAEATRPRIETLAGVYVKPAVLRAIRDARRRYGQRQVDMADAIAISRSQLATSRAVGRTRPGTGAAAQVSAAGEGGLA